MSSAEFVSLAQAVAWPAAVLFIAWYYRDQIKSLLPRVTKIGPTGLQLENSVQQNLEQSSSGSGQTLSESIVTIKQHVFPEQFDAQLDRVRKQLPKDVAGDAKKTEEFLLHFCAAMLVQLRSEQHYRVIFGSQILLLKRANDGTARNMDDARQIYETAKAANQQIYSDAGIVFERWLAFLVNTQLVIQSGEQLSIGIEGKGLLRYMFDNQLTEAKGL